MIELLRPAVMQRHAEIDRIVFVSGVLPDVGAPLLDVGESPLAIKPEGSPERMAIGIQEDRG